MTIGRHGAKRLVVAADAAARAHGIHAGMAAPLAQAMCVGLVMVDADPAADSAGLDRLALWLLRRYTPLVAADPSDGLILDITGAAHLGGGEHVLLAGIVGRLSAAGIAARAAVAPAYGAAHALARFVADPVAVCDEADGAARVTPLPVAALRLDANVVDGLRHLGFDTIGELAATPRAPLALRFGTEPGRRLDQMFGRANEPFEPIAAPELIRATQAFAEPIAAPETIARYIGQLAGRLCTTLGEHGLGARQLDLVLLRVDDATQAIRIGTARPLRDVARMTRLLCDRIETVSPGFGIEAMTLIAVAVEPLVPRPASSLVESPMPDLSELVDLLANRIGGGRLYRMALAESNVPERSARRVAALSPPAATKWPSAWPRPSRLLRRPEAIETVALLPDHPPAAFTWRGIRRRVCRADGPERVFGEWWRRDAELSAVRDYFHVEDDAGERFWLFRAGDGQDPGTGTQAWFIHGLFG